jgi:predicted nucleic acid-binding protein
MDAPVFVDTNVFIYALDPGIPKNRQRRRLGELNSGRVGGDESAFRFCRNFT